MLREQTITFLETTIVFLLLTNAVSVFAAAYAVSVASGLAERRREAQSMVTRKANTVLAAMWPSSAG